MNYHLKECIDWNSLLAEVNCYETER